MIILGISVGTRTSGLAILTNKGLISWHTLSFKNSWSEQKADTIIKKYERHLKHHNVTAVVLKIPRLSHHTDAILSLLKKIEKIVAFHGCVVDYKTQNDIKETIPHIRNREDLINHTASIYPVLTPERTKELANRNKYHDKMFEAVLVAHLWKEDHRF